MADAGGSIELMIILGVLCIVTGVFFAIRGFYRYKEWQGGDNAELWTFLSLVVGTGSLCLIGFPLVIILVGDIGEEVILASYNTMFVGLLLGLAAIGLTTFYYFQKWQSAK